MQEQIINVLKNINLILNEDGGSVNFVEYTIDKIVKVKLQGHCAECPFSQMTIKSLVEDMLKKEFGDKIASVEAIN